MIGIEKSCVCIIVEEDIIVVMYRVESVVFFFWIRSMKYLS